MQFSTIASIFAMASVAIAAPAPGAGHEKAPLVVRTGGSNNQPVCSAQSQQVCCQGLSCVLQVLGNGCSNTAYCCESNGNGGLINLNLLNCAKLL
ncbi:hypothetical protein F53441_2682 [Fusarium austroafricanum]|uniref:Hydrophobin 3 n=1 Tax=Fusarium austroafricanum TaxID=2364996 RepID=A0A8H4NXK4_9HYPO|nr:hypothetical protein F53441_2682 [Fusarium austroafricanum]